MQPNGNDMIEITVGICEAFKVIGIDISEADLRKFEQALYERGLNVAPRANQYRNARTLAARCFNFSSLRPTKGNGVLL
jgi:hypothetical protein